MTTQEKLVARNLRHEHKVKVTCPPAPPQLRHWRELQAAARK